MIHIKYDNIRTTIAYRAITISIAICLLVFLSQTSVVFASTSLDVTFDANGGEFTSGKKTKTVVVPDADPDVITDDGEIPKAAVGKLPIVKRDGYKFLGWFDDKSKGKKFNSTTNITSDTKLYAHWEGKKYKVICVSDGHKVDNAKKTVKLGKAYGELGHVKKSGYKFIAWYTERTGGVRITAKDIATYPKDLTLYARWKKTSSGVDNNNGSLPVLMYHLFYRPGDTIEESLKQNWMLESKFISHLKYLKKEKYYFPTWDEVIAYRAGQIDLPSKSVVITIDDGRVNFYKYAVTAALRYKVPITGFLIGKEAVDTPRKTKWIKKYSKKKYQEYIHLQSHTYNMHIRQTGGTGKIMFSTFDKIKTDMERSKKIIPGATIMAYPFGHNNLSSHKAIKAAGFKLAFTIQNGKVKPGAPAYSLPRVRINGNTSFSEFKRAVS